MREYGVDIDIEFFEAVAERKEDSELIKFKDFRKCRLRSVSTITVLMSICPKLSPSFLRMPRQMDTRSLTVPGFAILTAFRNKETVDEWMTEIQLPIKLS